MINAFSVVGLLLVATGVGLILSGLWRALRGVFRRHSYRKRPLHVEGQGIYSGAVTAKQVYVPGTIGRMLGLVILGVATGICGLVLVWAGLSLVHPYTPIAEPAELARVVFGPGSDVRVQTTGGESVHGDLAGSVFVAHVETIAFGGPLAQLGLGKYARLSSIGGYSGPAAVLERRGRILPVGKRHPLQRMARWLAAKQPEWVQVSERVSPPLRDSSGEVAVQASVDGIEWRR